MLLLLTNCLMCFDSGFENLVQYLELINFLNSIILSACKCTDTIRRNNMAITLETGSEYVFQNLSTQ